MPSRSDRIAREDIRRLERRLTGCARKSDVAHLNRELGAQVKRLDGKVDALAERAALRFDSVERRIDGLQGHFSGQFAQLKSDIFGKLDGFLARLETYSRETLTLPRMLDRQGKTLLDHERRLGALEAR